MKVDHNNITFCARDSENFIMQCMKTFPLSPAIILKNDLSLLLPVSCSRGKRGIHTNDHYQTHKKVQIVASSPSKLYTISEVEYTPRVIIGVMVTSSTAWTFNTKMPHQWLNVQTPMH